MTKTLCVIPARLESTRLPNKVLLSETGKPLIQHVWEQAKRASLIDDVVISTDSREIAQTCRNFGAYVFVNDLDHWCGSGRVHEVSGSQAWRNYDYYVNLQADEPEIEPGNLDKLIRGCGYEADSTVAVSTLATIMEDRRDFLSQDCVKVVVDSRNNALYFSRMPIPWDRVKPLSDTPPLLHLGVYCFKRSKRAVCLYSPDMPQCAIARLEGLEQLQLLWNQVPIRVVMVEKAKPGINTAADYKAFVESLGKPQ